MSQQSEVKLNDLPLLPFEKILSYLSLEDRTKSRAISRGWYRTISGFTTKFLCCSERPIRFVANRLLKGAFAKNFISFSTFESFGLFCQTFVQSILSNLKHLRLCDFNLDSEIGPVFAKAINSFSKLEELDLIDINQYDEDFFPKIYFTHLNLPMLTVIQLERVCAFECLTLVAPRLKEIKVLACYKDLRLSISHSELVERLLISYKKHLKVKKLKSLKSLYMRYCPRASPTFLFSLNHLQEIYLNNPACVSYLFEQKQRYGLVDMKIYLCGLLLDGPDDPATKIRSTTYSDVFDAKTFDSLAGDPSRLAE